MRINLDGFTIEETLYRSPRTIVLGALRQKDRKPFAVKTLDPNYRVPREIAQLLREYEIAKRLQEISGVIRVAALEKYDRDIPALVMEKAEHSLRQRLARVSLPLKDRIEMAIRMTRILGKIHRCNIIHKDIHPDNILCMPSLHDLRLTDFGISSTHPREREGLIGSTHRITGSLPYISPEQTGRMNRDIDYRSDYYSLGITLYEVFSGTLPFNARQGREWIYCHIASPPRPLHEANRRLPASLSAVVMKLLAKDPENRYQSADGIIADLEACKDLLLKKDFKTRFPPGRNDISERLNPSEKLYGREPEIRQLQEVTDAARDTPPPAVVISGTPGIGKSTLVRELQRRRAGLPGFFIGGRFDPGSREIPYSAVTHAFNRLVRQMLAEPPERITYWQEAISRAAGSDIHRLIHIIPELEKLFPGQGLARKRTPENRTEIKPVEAQNRFRVLFQDFIRIFAGKDHPLVLFLDDLQWSDAASLALLESLLAGEGPGHLLLIIAYRSSEVKEDHPVHLALGQIEKKKPLVRISLDPLGPDPVLRWLADSLQTAPERCRGLSEILREKTGGNPFFLHELLNHLWRASILRYVSAHGRGEWQWNEEEVRKQDVTDNIAAYLAENLQKLSPPALSAATAAACIGGRFDPERLGFLLDRPLEKVLADLEEAVEMGLLAPVHDTISPSAPRNHDASGTGANPPIYRFRHERLLQAAAELLPPSEKAAIHLRLGRRLLETDGRKKNGEPAGQEAEEKCFKAVHHLNRGRAGIHDPQERETLARLNLKAAVRARETIAYGPGLKHLGIAMELLGEDAWDLHYALAAELGLEVIRCAFYAGALEMAEARIEEMLEKMKTPLEKAEVRYLQSIQYTVAGRMEEGAAAAIAGLGLLGVRINRPRTALLRKASMLWEILRVRRYQGLREIEDLIRAPALTDPNSRMAIRLLEALSSLSYFTGDQYRFMQVNLKMAGLTLRHGNSRESALAYAYYGLLLSVMGKTERAQAFGKLAVRLNEDLGDLQFRCRIICLYAISIHHWKAHWETLTPLFDRAIEAGYRTGDFLSLGHSAIHAVIWNPKTDLETKLEKLSPYVALVRRIGYPDALDSILLARQMIRNLLGRTAAPLSMNDAFFDEARCIAGMEKRGYRSGLARYHFHKAEIAFYQQEYEAALNHIREGDDHIHSLRGTPTPQRYAFIAFLVHGACCGETAGPGGKKARKKALKRMKQEYRRMKKWARFSWVNFMHLQKIMEAEFHRLAQDSVKAEICYHHAIRIARTNGWIGDEALAWERCGRLWLERDRKKIAGRCFQEAHALYLRWGARSAARLLKEKEGLLFPNFSPLQNESAPAAPAPLSRTATSEGMDLDTVMKVSRAISAEFRIESLLRHLMESLIENSGAQKGMLILNEKGKFLVRAEKDLGGAEIRVTDAIPVENCDRLSGPVVRYVINSQKSLVLNDAGAGRFADTDYIRNQKPKSILCSPLLQRNRLVAVLYLENNSATHVFTRERVRILNLLMSQAAISIENARMYRQIEASERKYRSLYERAVEGIYQTTPEGRLISGNPSLFRILGYESIDEMPENITALYADHKDRELLIRKLKQEGRAIGFETRLKQKEGTIFWAALSAVMTQDPGGAPMIEGFLLDITERVEKEKAQQERIAAEKASRAKSEFLAVMSHEIRTPMNAIIALTDLTLKTELPPKQRKHLETVKVSADSLLNILNDILDYSKIEAGRLEMSDTDFCLKDLLEEIRSMFAARIAGTEPDFTLSVAPDIPATLVGDPLRLKQILVNLVGNAVKFTRKGEIALAVEPVEAEAEAVKLRFSVRDTGIGISRERLDHLFLPFSQADGSITRKYGGTGLGLSITRNLVEMMGGKIWVKSVADQGSTFFFTVRLARSDRKEAGAVKPPAQDHPPQPANGEAFDCRGKNIRVLLAEDNPINRQIVIEILSGIGMAVDTAPDGYEAMKMVTQKRYHAVLMDVQMPVMDGIEATRSIRSDPGFAALPIIAMTAHAMKGDRDRCMESGMNDYITKPIDIDLFFATLARWVPEMADAGIETGTGEKMPAEAEEGLPGIDMASARQRFRNNIGLLDRLIVKFEAEFRGAADRLREMIGKGDTAGAGRYCHQIKGVAANLSAMKLSDAARDLEMAMKNGSADGVGHLLAAFEAALDEIVDSAGRVKMKGRSTIS